MELGPWFFGQTPSPKNTYATWASADAPTMPSSTKELERWRPKYRPSAHTNRGGSRQSPCSCPEFEVAGQMPPPNHSRDIATMLVAHLSHEQHQLHRRQKCIFIVGVS
jgi:hypothetical protein